MERHGRMAFPAFDPDMGAGQRESRLPDVVESDRLPAIMAMACLARALFLIFQIKTGKLPFVNVLVARFARGLNGFVNHALGGRRRVGHRMTPDTGGIFVFSRQRKHGIRVVIERQFLPGRCRMTGGAIPVFDLVVELATMNIRMASGTSLSFHLKDDRAVSGSAVPGHLVKTGGRLFGMAFATNHVGMRAGQRIAGFRVVTRDSKKRWHESVDVVAGFTGAVVRPGGKLSGVNILVAVGAFLVSHILIDGNFPGIRLMAGFARHRGVLSQQRIARFAVIEVADRDDEPAKRRVTALTGLPETVLMYIAMTGGAVIVGNGFVQSVIRVHFAIRLLSRIGNQFVTLDAGHDFMQSGQGVRRAVMTETDAGGALPIFEIMACRTIVAQLSAMFVEMTGLAFRRKTQESLLKVHRLSGLPANGFVDDIIGFMAPFTPIGLVFADQPISCQFMVKMVLAMFPEDDVKIPSLVIKVAGDAFFAFDSGRGMESLFLVRAVFQFQMTGEAFRAVKPLPDIMALSAVVDTLKRRMPFGEFSGRELRLYALTGAHQHGDQKAGE